MIRVVVADDQALVRGGFRSLLDARDDIEVVGEAADGHEAVALAKRLTPDVVLMDARPGELVIGDKVRPQWIDGGARFWYAVSNGVGRRFVLVDPAAGTRESAFDHARLAAALAAASGQQVDPEALPFMAVELAGNAVEFGGHWRCRLDSYACERAEFTPPGNPLEVPSPGKKVAVFQRGHDLWARSLSDGREWARRQGPYRSAPAGSRTG